VSQRLSFLAISCCFKTLLVLSLLTPCARILFAQDAVSEDPDFLNSNSKGKAPRGVSVPGHALRSGPETSVTSPLRRLRFELRGHEKTYIQSSRPWECGNPEGISKECGKGGKPASWLSTLSILCHFHGLLFSRQMLDKPICRHPVQYAALATRCSLVLIACHLTALEIYHSSRGRL
jgi:hypothetical protein